MPRTTRLAALTVAALATAGLAACDPPPPPTTFTVNTTADASDASPGDGVCEATPGTGDCSLRAAIEEGNATGGPIEIHLAVESASAFDDLVVTTSMTIDGHGAALTGRFVHTGGGLGLRDMRITVDHAAACGVVDSSGDALVLDRVIAEHSSGHAVPTSALCATGDLVLVDSQISVETPDPTVFAGGRTVLVDSVLIGDVALEMTGPGPLLATNSYLPGVDAADAGGAIKFSWVGVIDTGSTEVTASLVTCRPGATIASGGHNLDEDGSCGADEPTDRAVDSIRYHALGLGTPMQIPPFIGDERVGAIPAGTPGLCDSTSPTDSRGAPRDGSRACDVGPFQTQGAVDVVGTEDQRAVVRATPAVVNASGTVAATFGDDVTTATAGRWYADGSFTSSEVPGSSANDIADDGTVVGSAVVDGETRPWRWAEGSSPETLVGPAGETEGELLTVDDTDGTVIGLSAGTSTTLWFQRPGGQPTALPTPADAVIRSVRNGIAVGHRSSSDGFAAVVWDLDAGTATDLPEGDLTDPDLEGSMALDIADDGTITGQVGLRAAVWRPGEAPTRVGIGYLGEAARITSDGHIAVSRGSGTHPMVVPAGTSDVRILDRDLELRDLGDDGTLIGLADESGQQTSLLVRLHLAFAP